MSNFANNNTKPIPQSPSGDDAMLTRIGQELLLGENLSRRMLEEEHEQLFRTVDDPDLRRRHIENLKRLEVEIDDINHDCRVMVNFDRWIQRPGRSWLFERYCSLAIADWNKVVANNEEPLVFRTGAETLQRHLSHCSFCRMRRRLAEGNKRMREAGSDQLFRGDEIVQELVSYVLQESLFRAQVPTLELKLEPGTGEEPTEFNVYDNRCEALNGHLLVPAQLASGARNIPVEVNVTWQTTGGGDKTEADSTIANRLAFPNQQHPDSVVQIGHDGCCEIPMLVPREAAIQGVVFKYCGHCFEGESCRRLASLTIPESTSQETSKKSKRVRGAVRTRGADVRGGPDEPAQRPKDVRTRSITSSKPIPVRVAAASLMWSG